MNAPYFTGPVLYEQTAIFWFGQVNQTSNYADVRVGYNDTELYVSMNIFDRRLWYNPNPSTSPLTAWDATTLYLDLDGNTGNAPGATVYRFDAQLDWWEPRAGYQAAYRGNGSGWSSAAIPITTTTGWRGNAPNDDVDDRGWTSTMIFRSVLSGFPGPPSKGTSWGMALTLHDRDDAAGTLIPDETWPDSVSGSTPSSWGEVSFGLPTFTPPPATPRVTVTIRQGLNGATVPDAAVGGTIAVDGSGSTLCPGDSNYIWNQWGNANFGGAPRFNIQNEADVSDWPCFARVLCHVSIRQPSAQQGDYLSHADPARIR